jgi:hypothetical protein
MTNKFDRVLNHPDSLSRIKDRDLSDEKKKDDVIKNLDYIRNNISNHPETREAAMLYYYIYIKLTEETCKVSSQISPYNSIASQFTRLLELDLFQKLSHTRMKKDEKEKEYSIDYLYSLITIIRTLNI